MLYWKKVDYYAILRIPLSTKYGHKVFTFVLIIRFIGFIDWLID